MTWKQESNERSSKPRYESYFLFSETWKFFTSVCETLLLEEFYLNWLERKGKRT